MFEKIKEVGTKVYEYRYLASALLLLAVIMSFAMCALETPAAQIDTLIEDPEVFDVFPEAEEVIEEAPEDATEEVIEGIPHAYNTDITRDNFINAYVVEAADI
jgi:hypothetical protein